MPHAKEISWKARDPSFSMTLAAMLETNSVMFFEVGGREELRMLVLKCGSCVNVNKYFVSKENLTTVCGPCKGSLMYLGAKVKIDHLV